MAQAASESFAPYEVMGPNFLADQPVSDIKKKSKVHPGWENIYIHLESRLSALRNWRFTWWSHWAELARYILPRRYHWLITANTMTKGRPKDDAIIDNTATLAMQICASGLWTGLTSPSRPWFQLEKAMPWVELDQDGQAWIEDTQDRLYTVLAKSNLYQILAQAFQDVVVFGTAPVIIYEDDVDVVRGYIPCAGEYYLANSSRLDNDTLYREFTLTVVEIVNMFGVENCPEQVLKLWKMGKASLEMEFVIAHSIEPNFEVANPGGDPVKVVSGKFPFREVYWLKGIATERPLSIRGFNERPFMVARWTTVSNDAYGRSIGMMSIGDIKQIQLETRRKAEYIDKGVRPPMGADPDLKNEPSSIVSGMITFMNTSGGKKGFWPLFEPNPAWLTGITADIEMVKKRVQDAFFVDIFMAISRMEGVQPRNELELTKRDLERLQVLGPFIELFETEFAGPMIERILAVMLRRNLLKPMPPSMRGVQLKIEYVSIMKLAQRSAELVAMKDVVVTAGVASNAAKAAGVPDPLRILNLDEWMRQYADLGGLKSTMVYTKEEVQSHDQIRMQHDKMAQLAQQAPGAVEAAKSLSQTPMGGNTALSAMVGGGGAPA